MNVPAQERLGETQARFRRVNQRLIATGATHVDGSVRIVCECSDERCVAPITLSTPDYGTVRAHPAWFVVHPEHVDPIEETIAYAGRGDYVVVEKFGDALATVLEYAARDAEADA